VALSTDETNLYEEVIALSSQSLSDNDKYSIAYFIHDGTNTTIRLGAGERAGVLHSYSYAFNRPPGEIAE